MSDKPLIVVPEIYREALEDSLGAELAGRVTLRGFSTPEEAMALAPEAEIGWFDEFAGGVYGRAPRVAVKAKWLNTVIVGFDAFPIDEMRARGQIFTNGAGLMPDVIADYAVMGALVLAKRLDEVVRAHDRQTWLTRSPGTFELRGARALVIGYGAIGREIGTRLRSFGVAVTGVRRSADHADSVIGPGDWRLRLAEFDFVIVAAPNTSETREMIGAEELAAMKPGARLINIARGDLIDQPALIAALESGHLGGAFLDVATPEPLPPEDPLWRAPNILITMHLSGRSQNSAFQRGAERFVRNIRHYLAGEPLEYVADLHRDY
ncbi:MULTISPECIES: D-2-hydroxyacid dehydrogenase [Sphingobium]|uniref:D-2-hydroxyacid dehydrogenase n=1 Tax=Sphingobium TaxID=165695 RepID=UPI0015EC7E54|nr:MULTISPECIES: D-2-hydroxyacid dehydrogenase [Sphingobium]MCW2362957.1 phosphoglycerate dehydrogenase-like enzyme [Sphingobium sp. B10D3B]MCW2400363.1 phosphoglycerate dehydrogenase-like enzyme [Sphingobium sp. B10D7B]MCW2407341.1 phosphoglycerate dehydrogenase-like enzyme [Sphingobium xanthum]